MCLRTIDTDSLVQAALYVSPPPDACLDIHIANVSRTKGGDITAGKAPPKSEKCREIIDIALLCAVHSPVSLALVLVYGGDYIKGLSIRGLGLPKAALFDLIRHNAKIDHTCISVSSSEVVVHWPAFFRMIATACKPPAGKQIDIASLNTEYQRLVYCLAYFAGVHADVGGPPVDGREIVPPGATRQSLLKGDGCVPMTYN